MKNSSPPDESQSATFATVSAPSITKQRGTPRVDAATEPTVFTPTVIPLDLAPLDPAQNGVLAALQRIERNTARPPAQTVAMARTTPAKQASASTAPPTSGVAGKVDAGGNGASLRQQVYRVKRIERQADRALPPVTAKTATEGANASASKSEGAQTVKSPFARQRERVERQKETKTVVTKAVKKQDSPAVASDPQDATTKTAKATPERLSAEELRKLPLRGDSGKFLSRDEKAGMSQAELAQTKARESREKSKEADKDRSLLGQVGDKLGEVAKGTLDGKGDATDGVGTAVGNAYYSAAKEAYGAYQELAGEDSKARELYQWARGHWDKRRSAEGEGSTDGSTTERHHEETLLQASETSARQATADREREKQAEAHRDDTSEELEALADISEDGFEEVVKEIKRIDGGGGGLLPSRFRFGGGGGGGARGGRGGRNGGGTPQRGRVGRLWDRVRSPFTRAPAATTAASTGTTTATRAATTAAQAAPRASTGARLLGGSSRALGVVAAPLTGALAYNSTRNELAERDDLTQAQKTTTAAATGVGAGGGALAGAAAGAGAGALVGSVVPVVGTAVGGLLGGIIGGALGAWGGEKAGRTVGDAVASTMDSVEEEARNALDERESRQKQQETKERKWYNPASWFSGSTPIESPTHAPQSFSSMPGAGGRQSQAASGTSGEREQSLIRAMHDAGITDPNEQAAFMGQMHHESAGFSSMEESFNYSSADRIMSVSRTARNQGEAAVEQARAQGPEAVAELMYGGRMGNTEPGDGYKYRGRGFTQLTGRDNYTAASEALGVDLVSNPEMAADPEIAAKVSAWYWKERGGLSEAAQRGDTQEVTRLINGGHNGIEDRAAQTSRYLAAAQAGELTAEPQPEANATAIATTSPASPTTAEADTQPMTATAARNDVASSYAPAVEPVLPSEPVTPIDNRQAARAFHPAPQAARPPAALAAPSAPSAPAQAAANEQAPRGGTQAPGVNDIQVGFSDPILTLMAMDRI